MSVNTSPPFVTAGTRSSASRINQLADGIQAAWEPWTPTWSGVTVGDGTVSADFLRIGHTIHFRMALTLGAGSALGGVAIVFSAPAAAVSHRWRFEGEILDAGTANYPIHGRVVPSTSTANIELVFRPSGGLTDSPVTGAAGAPFLMGAGDIISVSGTYEAA